MTLEALYRAHHADLVRFGAWIGAPDPEGAVMDVWATVQLHQVPADAGPYLRGAVKRQALRQRLARQSAHVPCETSEGSPDDRMGVTLALEDCLGRLTTKEAQALDQLYLRHRSTKDAAAILATSANALSHLKRRTVAKLNRCLAQKGASR